MKIDLRILVPFVMPFAIALTARLLWFVAGAHWDSSAIPLSVISLILGVVGGLILSGILFDNEIEIGHITLPFGKGTSQ